MFEDGQGGGSPAVPSGGGDQPKIDPAGVIDMLKRGSQPHTSIAPLKMNPQMGKSGLMANIGMNLLNTFVPQIGGAVQKAVKAQKEKQINEAVNDFSTLHNSWEEMQIAAGGDAEKAKQLFEQDPRVQAILGDKKKQKLIAKAFSVDWMNPEKTANTAHFQGLKRFMDLKNAHGQMKQIQQMMQERQSQPQAAQGQDAAQMTQGAAQTQQLQPEAQPKPNEGAAKAEQFLTMWPKTAHAPGIPEAEKSSIAMKNVMEAAHIGEPKTEFEAWIKAYREEHDGKGPSTQDIQAHHDANKLDPVMQLIQDGINMAQEGDTKSAEKAFQLAHVAKQALKPESSHPSKIDLIMRMNAGDKEAGAAYKKLIADETAERMSYGMSRAMYAFQPYIDKQGHVRAIDGVTYRRMVMDGNTDYLPVPGGRMDFKSLTALQTLGKEAGPSGTKDYEHGVIKQLKDNAAAFDSAKNRAVFAKAMNEAKPGGDWVESLKNVLNQVAVDQLDEKGRNVYAAQKRMAETMGTFRQAMGMGATDRQYDIGAALIPGAQTPDSKMALKLIDQLDTMIKLREQIPAFSGEVTPKAGKKQMDF